jgi:hypothetical protein
VAAAAAVAAAAYMFLPVPELRVARPESGEIVWRIPVANGAQIDLNYVNSLYDAPTTERFVITGGQLRLIEINSTKRAVLEYLALEPPYEERGDRVVSKRRGPLFNELTLRIGQTGQQRLVAGGRELPLFEVGTGEAVVVRVSRGPRVLALLRRTP